MKVLLPTDGSAYSDAAAAFLKKMGLGEDDEVHVLHVVKDYLLPDEVDAARDFKAASMKGAKRLVDDYAARNFPGMPKLKKHVRDGEPWQEIDACAAELGADLVAIGHRGLSGIRRFMLGSTAYKVVRHAACSVLVVRETPTTGSPFSIVFCTDGTASSALARDVLVKLPMPPGTNITAVSVVDMEVASMPEVYYPDEDTSKMMAELREHFRGAAQAALDKDTGVLSSRFGKVGERIIFGMPDQEIINAAHEMDADLVVMGCRELGGIAGALLGSASYRVLKHIGCSMLIAKSGLC